MDIGFFSDHELLQLGFKSVGENVMISKRASLYNCAKIVIGNNCRIDDFCILSAGEHGITLGNHVHIACYASLIGKNHIMIDDFAGVSSKAAIYSSNDDYSGNFLTGPTVPAQYTNVRHADVHLGKHVIVGVFTTILPGVTVKDGAAIGAYSLINKDVDANIIVAGVPAKKIKDRSLNIYDIEKKYKKSL